MSLPGHFELDASDIPNQSSYNHSLRRPWSPLRYDAYVTDNGGTYDYLAQERIPGSLLRGERGRARRVQNISENSVEALDLADYSRTLRGLTTERNDAYPPFPYTSHVHPLSVPTPAHANSYPSPLTAYPEYPSSPDNSRPFSAQSRDTFNQAPPSLVSGSTSYDTHESYGSPSPYPQRRPYSLPPFLASVSAGHLPTHDPRIVSPLSDSHRHSAVRIASPVWDERDEVDISRFPAFSRTWYDDPHKPNARKHSSLPPYSSENQYDRTGSFNPLPSTASNQSRSILPWGSQPEEAQNSRVDDIVKEERIRMLEYEFGKKGAPTDSEAHIVGSVDEKGALITAGPKRRFAARWAQGLLALATVISSLYGALFIKSPTPAPPASKLPAFALYIFSVVTFLFLFYLFALRPCCCGKRGKSAGSTDPRLAGMMVLPVQGLPGDKKKKKKKGKNGKHGGGDVQVNLIVDPSMFMGSGKKEEYESEGDYDFEGSQVSSQRRGGHGQAQQRRGIFQGLAMENDWKAARKFVRRMLFVDIACCIVWGGVFALVLFGKKCPPGGFNGWCNSYNIASATACILCVAFAFSAYFDMIDLHMSKVSPRTRT